MDFHQAETRFLQLQENYRNNAITGEAFFQAVSKLMVQDDEDRYWTIDPQTGGWLYYDGHTWQSGTPPTSAVTQKMTRAVQPPRSRNWMPIALTAGAVGFGVLVILGLVLYRVWFMPSRPEVTITSPADGAQVLIGEDVAIESLGVPSKGINRVELWVDDEMVVPETNLPADSSGPVTLHWMFQDVGSHKVKVRAYNSAGVAGESRSISVSAVSSSRDDGANLVILQGAAEIRQGESEQWYPASGNSTVIQPDSTVRTSGDGRVQVVFSEGIVAELAADTEMSVQQINLKENESSLVRVQLQRGDSWHRIDSKGTPLTYEIVTPGAIVSSHGTLVHVTTTVTGATSLEVVEGEVLMTAADETRPVLAGQQARAEPGSQPVLAGQPALSAAAAAATEPLPCEYDATVIDDVTLPPGTVLEPDERVEKIWRMRNTGNCPWTDFKWTFLGGDLLGAQESNAVPRTEPGGTVDLSVLVEVPVSSGTYTSTWQLQDAQGQYIGQVGDIQIQVSNVASPPATSVSEPQPEPVSAITVTLDATAESAEPTSSSAQ